MDIKLAFALGLLLIATANGQSSRESKTCEGPSQVSGGSLDEMVGLQFPCGDKENSQQNVNNEAAHEDDKPSEITPTDERFYAERSDEIAQSVLALSQRLTQNILGESKRKFEIVSPISIASALQLAFLGSNGKTFNELMDLMNFSTDYASQTHLLHEWFGFMLEDLVSNAPNPSRPRSKVPWRQEASKEYLRRSMKYQSSYPNDAEHFISVVNGIFVQKDFSIRDEFKEVVEGVYMSKIQSLDFRGAPQESAKVINDWVNESTHGKIKEIIPGGTNPETKVILANALYFKAEWQETFIDGATGIKNFYPHGRDSNHSIPAELMAHGGKFPYYYDRETDCEILGMPYKQNATTMYVIMPKNSNEQSLRALQKTLTADKIESMIAKMTIKTAVILFPKMHLKSGHQLKTNMLELGLKSLFDVRESDLSVMSDGRQVVSAPATKPPKRTGLNNRIPYTKAPQTTESSRVPLQQNNGDSITFPRLADDVKSHVSRVPLQQNNGDSSTFSTYADAVKSKVKREVSYKVKSEGKSENPLSFKDFVLRKRIVKSKAKKLQRNKRQTKPFSGERLDVLRQTGNLQNPYLFAEEIIHKVDLTINEKGTEGGAATAITLNRSGTNVVFRVDVPFMFLIRHDPTHVPLFYGVVFEPQN